MAGFFTERSSYGSYSVPDPSWIGAGFDDEEEYDEWAEDWEDEEDED